MSNDVAVNAIMRHWRRAVGEVHGYKAIDHHTNVFIVSTKRGEQFTLKCVGSVNRLAQFESYAHVLRYLHSVRIPVAAPILSDEQHLFVVHGSDLYTLVPVLPNDGSLAVPSKHIYCKTGRAVAYLHRALKAYAGEILSWQMNLPHRSLDEAVPVIRAQLDTQSLVRFDCVLREVETEIRSALTGLPEQYIHGDCHGGNVLLYKGDVSGFIDFDHLPYGPRIYDLAYMLADRVKFHNDDPIMLERWLAHFKWFVVGYEQVEPLTGKEQHAIWYAMLAVQLIFTEWFFSHDMPDAAAKNLAVLYWVYQHKRTIMMQCSGKEDGT